MQWVIYCIEWHVPHVARIPSVELKLERETMSRSTASSEPLSSPPPSPRPKKKVATSAPSSAAAPKAAGLDSGSELTDLSDEEEKPRYEQRRNEEEEDDEDEDEDEAEEEEQEEEEEEEEERGPKRSPHGMPRRRSGGLVPAPMWGWAYKKTKSGSRRSVSSSRLPATATETRASASPRPSNRDRANSGGSSSSTEPLARASVQNTSRHLAKGTVSDDEDREAGDTKPAGADDVEDEDDNDVGDDEKPTENDGDDDDDEKSAKEEDDDMMDEPLPAADVNASASPAPAIEDGTDDDDALSATSETSLDMEWATQLNPSRGYPNEDESEDFAFLPRHIAISRRLLLDRHAARTNGEEVEEPTRSEALEVARRLARDETNALTLGSLADVASTAPNMKVEGETADEKPRDEQAEEGEEDVEVEVEGEQDPEQPVDDDDDAEDGDEALEADAEGDLHTPQREEALTMLAEIEVKFAILRERLYLDKMEETAQEEATILNETHPELLHFLSVLSERKERRLALATKRRQHEEQFIRKRRKDDEESVWSWWRVQMNDLRDTMVAEANGKRRRLEREKRSLESRLGGTSFSLVRGHKLTYLQSVRTPSISADIYIPPPQSIRQIIKNHHRPISNSDAALNITLPNLSTLNDQEIAQDLDKLLSAKPPTSRKPGEMSGHVPYPIAPDQVPPDYGYEADPYSGGYYSVAGYPAVANHTHVRSPPPVRQDLNHSVNASSSSRAYPSTMSNHATSAQPHPPTSYPSSQHSRNYNPSQYSQPSSSSSHHHSAPVVPRKRSLSPNRNMQMHGPASSNGWDDVHRRTKVPRLGGPELVEPVHDWGYPPVSESSRRNQRHTLRATMDYPYDAIPPDLRDRSVAPSRALSDYPPDRYSGHLTTNLPQEAPDPGAWTNGRGDTYPHRREDGYSLQFYPPNPPPSRPSSQPIRPPSPSHRRHSGSAQGLHPPSTNLRRTPLPPASNVVPNSPSLPALRKTGSTSPVLNRLQSNIASPAPITINSSSASKTKSSSPALIPTFPLPPLPPSGGPSTYMVFPSSGLQSSSIGGAGSGSGSTRTSAVPPPHPVSVE